MANDMSLVSGSRSPQSALQIDSLSMQFGGLKVFNNISFAVEPGETFGVIGPNGAGKTTLINLVCGLLAPSAGKIMLGDRDITGTPIHTVSRLGVVRSFQQTNTFKLASVEENLYRAKRFGALRPGPDLKLESLLDEFALGSHLREPSNKLPYGLQKMLGLVMVLATRPRFLLLDEPAAGLERRERSQIDLFIEHAKSTLNCGILIVEHDMELVRRLCPYIVVLEAGHLLAEGHPDDVLSRTEVIDAYLGSSED